MGEEQNIVSTAIVREVPASFVRAIRPPGSDSAIDVDRARRQHIAYAQAIAACGAEIVRIAADEDYPDCCFVEDPVFVAGGRGFVCNMAPESRRGEAPAVAEVVSRYRPLVTMESPATMDGGDVIAVGDTVYVGRSQRTNAAGIRALSDVLKSRGVTVVAVTLRGVLHLKSACTYLGGDRFLVARGFVDDAAFPGRVLIDVADGEEYAANCLAVNGRVLTAAGYPATHERLHDAGFDVVPLDMSEFRKAGGSLTCLSILL